MTFLRQLSATSSSGCPLIYTPRTSFEKEVLGVYISGHPLDDVAESWRRNVTAVTSDFYVNEEIGMPNVVDQSLVVIGGMVTGKTVKSTKNNKMMAFIQLEDLLIYTPRTSFSKERRVPLSYSPTFG